MQAAQKLTQARPIYFRPHHSIGFRQAPQSAAHRDRRQPVLKAGHIGPKVISYQCNRPRRRKLCRVTVRPVLEPHAVVLDDLVAGLFRRVGRKTRVGEHITGVDRCLPRVSMTFRPRVKRQYPPLCFLIHDRHGRLDRPRKALVSLRPSCSADPTNPRFEVSRFCQYSMAGLVSLPS